MSEYERNIAFYESKLTEYKAANYNVELYRVCVQRFEENLRKYKAENREIYKIALDALINLLRMFDNVVIRQLF